jgi:hypothetical protein
MKRERRAGRVKGYYANHEKRFALPAQTCHDILVIRPAQGNWAGAKTSNSTLARKQAQARIGRIARRISSLRERDT